MSTDIPELPKALEKAIDTVLAYRPKPNTKAAKKRKRKEKNQSSKKPSG